MIYYVIFFALFTLALVEIISPSTHIVSSGAVHIRIGNNRVATKRYNVLATLIVLLLILMAGFRWETGIDFGIYKNAFTAVKSGRDISDSIEITYILAARFLPSLTYVFFFYAIVSIGLQYKVLKEQSALLFASLFLLFPYLFLRFDMGIIRQGLAISVTLYSIKYIIKRNFFGFNVCMFIAVMVHNSSIIFYPAYFLTNLRFSKSTYLILISVCFVLGLTNIWNYIAAIIARLPIPLIGKYMSYLTGNYITQQPFTFSDLNEMVFFSFALYSLRDIDSESDKRNLVLLNIYFVGTCIMYLMKSVNLIYGRGVAYYLIVDILLLPAAIANLKNRSSKVFALFLLAAFSFVRIYNMLSSYSVAVWPNYSYDPYLSVLWQ